MDSSNICPSERLTELFLTTLALATEMLSVADKKMAMDVEGDEDTNGSRDDKEKEAKGEQRNVDSLLAIEVCQNLWLISQSACVLDLYDDGFGLREVAYEAGPHDLCREVIMIDLLHACSTSVSNLPSNLGGRVLTSKARAGVLGKLASRQAEVASLHSKRANHLSKRKRKNKRTKKKNFDEHAVECYAEGAHLNYLEDGTDVATADDLQRTEECRGMSLVTVRGKSRLATFLIKYLYGFENEESISVDQSPAQASQFSQFDRNALHLDDTEIWLLTRFSLESSLLVIETLLNRASKLQIGFDADEDLDMTVWGLQPLLTS